MSATSERDLAIRIAKTDFAKALPLVQNVSRPWFHCQALAFVARYAPDDQVSKVAKTAIDAALASEEPYDIAATAWPLRALIERNRAPIALQILPSILVTVPRIEPPVSRGDAMFLLWEALFPVGGSSRQSLTSDLFQVCLEHQKGHRTLREAALILASEDLKAAQRLADLIPEGKYKRQAQKRLEEGQKFQVRSFFF